MATILTLAGDGIGPEIMTQAIDVLKAVNDKFSLDLTLESGLIGGVAIDATGEPLPDETLARARAADAYRSGAAPHYLAIAQYTKAQVMLFLVGYQAFCSCFFDKHVTDKYLPQQNHESSQNAQYSSCCFLDKN